MASPWSATVVAPEGHGTERLQRVDEQQDPAENSGRVFKSYDDLVDRTSRRSPRPSPGRQDQGRALALLWPDRAEDVGGSGALITGCAWAGAAFRRTAGNLVLLADTGLVCKPDLYLVAVDRLFTRDCIQARGEVFFKPSITSSA